MKIARYITGIILVLALLAADAALGKIMFSRWFYLLLGATLFAMIRLTIGASNHERLLSFRVISLALTGVCVILAVSLRKDIYIDIAVAWALQSYMVTLLLSKYLQGSRIDD